MEHLISVVQRFLTPWVIVVVTVVSVAMFVLSIVGIPWFVTRLPEDYFSGREKQQLGLEKRARPFWRVVLTVLRNVLGGLIFIAGVAMLALPGQGLIAIFIALLLTDFPGKKRLERRIIRIPPILHSLNSLRRRAGKPPLRLESRDRQR